MSGPDLESLDGILWNFFEEFTMAEPGISIDPVALPKAINDLLAWADKRSYEAILELIGEDEPFAYEAAYDWSEPANSLREQLRTAAKARYDGGQDDFGIAGASGGIMGEPVDGDQA